MSILFLALFVVVPFILLIMCKIAKIDLSKISLLSFVVFCYFVFNYIGLLPLYFYWDSYRFSIGVTDRVLIEKMFLLSTLSMLLILSGCIFVRDVMGQKYSDEENIGYIPVLGFRKMIWFYLIVLVCLFALGLYLSKISEIAIFSALSNGKDVALARSNMGNNFHGKYHWYKLFFSNFLVFALFVLLADFLSKKKIYKAICLIFVFLITMFSAVMATEKAPAIWIILGLFFVYMGVKFNYKFSWRFVLLLSLIVATMLFSAYMMFTNSDASLVTLKSMLSRAFTGQITPAYFYLDLYPSKKAFLLGSSLPNPGGVFPFESYKLTVEVMNYVFPNTGPGGPVGSMPTAFWGEAYVNFGIIGVVVSSFLMGIYIYIIYFFISKLEVSALSIGLNVWLILHFKNIVFSGISTFLFDFYLINITIFVLAVYFFTSGKIIFYKRIGYGS